MAHNEITVDISNCKVRAVVEGKVFDMSGEAAVVLPALNSFLKSALRAKKTGQLARKAKHGR